MIKKKEIPRFLFLQNLTLDKQEKYLANEQEYKKLQALDSSVKRNRKIIVLLEMNLKVLKDILPGNGSEQSQMELYDAKYTYASLLYQMLDEIEEPTFLEIIQHDEYKKMADEYKPGAINALKKDDNYAKEIFASQLDEGMATKIFRPVGSDLKPDYRLEEKMTANIDNLKQVIDKARQTYVEKHAESNGFFAVNESKMREKAIECVKGIEKLQDEKEIIIAIKNYLRDDDTSYKDENSFANILLKSLKDTGLKPWKTIICNDKGIFEQSEVIDSLRFAVLNMMKL